MTKAMKFRKKPVVIEAVQLTKDSIRKAYEFMHGPVQGADSSHGQERWLDYENIVKSEGMSITTLEDGPDGRAKHVATIGDWIIKGVQGEFYPCKPDIFEATYEPAGAILEAFPAPVWRDMDSAPKDGTEVLGRQGQKRIRLMWYFKASSRTQMWRDENGNEFKPDAWCPLPTPAPVTQSGEQPGQGVLDAERRAYDMGYKAGVTAERNATALRALTEESQT